MIGAFATRIEGDFAEKLRAKLLQIQTLDYSPVLGEIGRIAAIGSIDRIKTQKTAPDGSAWAPWSPGYAASGRGDTLLDLGGQLAASIDSFVSGQDEVTVYAERPYAARQHFGFRGTDSAGRSVNHPERPYLGLSDADLVLVTRALADFAVEALS